MARAGFGNIRGILDCKAHGAALVEACRTLARNQSYAAGEVPSNTGEPEPLLVEFVNSGRVRPTQTLEIGAGTGTNSLWLAERGFEVLGVDVAPLAVERANAKLDGRRLSCHFGTLDFLAASPLGGRFTSVVSLKTL